MNLKALVVLGWAGLTLYVIFRDWGSSDKVLQEMAGIWLLSVGALVIAEASPQLAMLSEAFLAVDVVIKPGSTDVGQTFAETVSKILPGATPASTASTAKPQGVVV